MAVRKISATLSEDVLSGIRERVGPRGLSAWLDAVARERLAAERSREELLAWLSELDAQDPATEEERAAADGWFRTAFGRAPG